MRRGDFYLAHEKGPLTGKPRPVLIVQNDRANDVHATVTVCLVSATLSGHALFRIPILPTSGNGLDRPSEVQVDRLFSFLVGSLDHQIGILSPTDLRQVDQALRRWLDL